MRPSFRKAYFLAAFRAPSTASAPLSVEEVLREHQDDVPAAQTDDKPETEGETSEQPPISDEPDTPAEDESKKESSENE